jgi:hypothetical protein
MTKGTGLGVQAVRELIAARFKEVHGDVRDAAGVRASREMAAEIEKPVERPIEVIRKAENAYDEQEERAFHLHSEYLSGAALRSGHIHSHRVLPRGVHQCYVVEAPSESASELIEQALRQMGVQ